MPRRVRSSISKDEIESRKYRLKNVKICTMGRTFIVPMWAKVSDTNDIEDCKSGAKFGDNEIENNYSKVSKEAYRNLDNNIRKEDAEKNLSTSSSIKENHENMISSETSPNGTKEREKDLTIILQKLPDSSEEMKCYVIKHSETAEIEWPKRKRVKIRKSIWRIKEAKPILNPSLECKKILYEPKKSNGKKLAITNANSIKIVEKCPAKIQTNDKPPEMQKKGYPTYKKSLIHKSQLDGCTSLKRIRKKTFECGVEGCGKTFSSKSYLKTHIIGHNADKYYDCPLDTCGSQFISHNKLKNHICTHINGGKCPEEILSYVTTEQIKFHVCPTCGKNFVNINVFKRHSAIHGPAGEKPFKCEIEGCRKTFSNKFYLKMHIPRHNAVKRYNCPLNTCGFQFINHIELKSHICTHINNKECPAEILTYVATQQIKFLVCPTCGKNFATISVFKNHLLVHRPVEEKSFKCEIKGCEKAYTVKRNLDLHIRMHYNDRISECPLSNCSKKFMIPAHLHKHICCHINKNYFSAEALSYLDEHKVTRYVCATCKKIFANKDNLRNHMVKHTGCKKFQCKISGCGKLFAYQKGLNRHARVHQGDKTFVCPLKNCQYAFFRQDNLNQHICVHINQDDSSAEAVSYLEEHKIRTYNCTYCDRTFIYKTLLEKHQLSHKNKIP